VVHQTKEIREALIEGLKDEDVVVRQFAISAVASMSQHDDLIKKLALPILKELVQEGKEEPNRSEILDLIENIEEGLV
jgi:HEAT repeat protein